MKNLTVKQKEDLQKNLTAAAASLGNIDVETLTAVSDIVGPQLAQTFRELKKLQVHAANLPTDKEPNLF